MQREIIDPSTTDKPVKQTKIDDWYNKLIFDLKKLQFYGYVKYHWDVGNRVLQDFDENGFPKKGRAGDKRLENVAHDINMGIRSLQKSIQFRKEYPEWRNVVSQLEGKTWKYIANDVLPEHKTEEPSEITPLPEGQYGIIYADPPWDYEGNLPQRNPVKHYNTLKTPEIASMPVSTIAGDNSCLFLWSTFPKLLDALEVMNAWGFEYKTCAFVWIKQNKKDKGFFWGLGGWTRANAEICLLGIKGEPQRQNKDVHSVIMSPIEEHSKKPDETRDRIVQLCGDIPRIELFCRQPVDGWDSWGDEIDKK